MSEQEYYDDRSRSRENDLVLAPNEFAYVLDKSKGEISVHVGPIKTSISPQTDKLVVFDRDKKRFIQANHQRDAIQTFQVAPEGWYIQLKNPGPAQSEHPNPGKASSLPDLQIGKKVNLAGPQNFALWPGQMTQIIQGHHMRSNQFLVARVYDEDAARGSFDQTVLKPQTQPDTDTETVETLDATKSGKTPFTEDELTMGNLIIIKGTDYSFYMPSDGIEVIPEQVMDEEGHIETTFVRDAVTLERLEYCILLDEDGNKRFVEGPDVVFPKPTETFVEDQNGTRKFKAIELNEISGIYVKVIADYEDDYGTHKVGDELFITGKDQMIYFPREEHAIIMYGNRRRHFAVEIPKGDSQYVLDRISGEIVKVDGPKMFLPDPRREVIVRRVLDQKTVELWYPNNQAVKEFNEGLEKLMEQGSAYALRDQDTLSAATAGLASMGTENIEFRTRSFDSQKGTVRKRASKRDTNAVVRKTAFTPPRSITIDNKFPGVPRIEPYTGYAVQVVSKTGDRKVITGPATYRPEFDETLEVMELSMGVPKSEDRLLKTVYLRVLNNKVTDKIRVQTKDLCDLDITLVFTVNFLPEHKDKWFDVENYIKFLTERMRSILKNAVKAHGAEDFYNANINILRDTILGTPKDSKEGVTIPRPGYMFEENGMKVVDVEIVDVVFRDYDIHELLSTNQQEVMVESLEDAKRIRKEARVKKEETSKQKINDLVTTTELKRMKHQAKLTARDHEKNIQAKLDEMELVEKQKTTEAIQIEIAEALAASKLGIEKDANNERIRVEQAGLEALLGIIAADTANATDKARVFTPQLVAALQSLADANLLTEATKSLSPIAMLGGKSIAETLSGFMKNTKLSPSLIEELRIHGNISDAVKEAIGSVKEKVNAEK